MKKSWGPLLGTVLVAGLLALLYARGYLPYVGLGSAQPHPRGHDDVVVRLSESAGMGTEASFFSKPPDLVVTGDGTAYAYRWGSASGIVAPVVTFHLDEGGIQSLLKRAAHDRLLAAPPSYPSPDVQDGGETDVWLSTDRGSWHHSAYALAGAWGFTASGRLADFVGAARSLAMGAHAEPYRPTTLRVLATPTDPPPATKDVVADWPSGTGVDLATVGHCAEVTSPAAIRVLTSGTYRYYAQHGQTYEVAAAVSLPGDPCSSDGGS